MSYHQELYQFLSEYLTPHKKELFQRVLKERTRHVTVVLEDIYQPHNASAVLRSADCFGIQDIHIIENENEHAVKRDVALGSANWLSLHHYNDQKQNTSDCLNHLKAKGYKIISTTPHTNDQLIDQLDLSDPVALVFGTETTGISKEAEDLSDGFVKIPMYGFTESFNISVAAALTFYEISQKLRSDEINWGIPEKDKHKILVDWALNTIRHSDRFVKEFDRRFEVKSNNS